MNALRTLLACVALAACGGDLLETPQASDSGQIPPLVDAAASADSGHAAVDAAALQDAGGDACTVTDASSVVCGPWSSFVQGWQSDPSAMSQCPWDGGQVFNRMSEFLRFFRQIAVAVSFVDPAHNVDCTSGVSTCIYDPRLPQLSPQDVHYSNGVNEFVAPDGQPYVWRWEPTANVWLTADESTSLHTYELIGARNQICPGAPCTSACSCPCGG
jgi:hypothetical protein